MNSQLLGFLMGAHDAVDPVAVGEGERAKAQAMGFFHQLFRMARAFEKRAVGLAEKRNIGRRRHIVMFLFFQLTRLEPSKDTWCKKGDMEMGEMWR
jgi:hypothetical protein